MTFKQSSHLGQNHEMLRPFPDIIKIP